MKSIRLGRTGLKVSRIGMGGIPLQRPSFKEAVKVIQRALDLGINFIDTSVAYGDSERRIGAAIAGRRDEVVLATKTSWRTRKSALDWLKKSLASLNVDYIDLYQFHNVSTADAWERLYKQGALKAVQQAKEEGTIGHIGISSHSIEIALKAVASGDFETIQFPFNYVVNHAADKLVPLAKEYDVGFIAMKAFAGGQLSDAALSIKYLLQFDCVLPDPGIETIAEVEEIVRIAEGSWELSSQEQQRIEEIREELSPRLCMWCHSCMPCPQKVNIPYLMNIESMLKLWPPKVMLKRQEKQVASWSNCDRCGECEEKCPHHLRILDTIEEQVAFFKLQKAQR